MRNPAARPASLPEGRMFRETRSAADEIVERLLRSVNYEVVYLTADDTAAATLTQSAARYR